MRGCGRGMRWVGLVAVLLASLIAPAPGARAATLTVTTCADDAATPPTGSLRAQIAAAGAGDTITFAVDCATSPIALQDVIFITKDLTIDATQPAPRAIIIDDTSNSSGAAFVVDGSSAPTPTRVTVRIAGLTIRNGSASPLGGAIAVGDTALTLAAMTFTANQASFAGGAIYNSCKGALTVSRSTFTGNQAGNGGAVYNECAGTAQIAESVFTGNSANSGGAIASIGTLTVQRSTFRANVAIPTSGGFGGEGGAITSLGTTNIVNSTFTGNQSVEGGAVAAIGGVEGGPVQIVNSTLSGNSAGTHGGAIAADGPALIIVNTLLAANTAPTGANCDGTVTDGGRNLEFNPATTCGLTTGAPKFDVLADPKLAPILADNGGPTPTFALLAGSAAIDAGDATVCAGTSGAAAVGGTDQRGLPRPATVCTIGAFEPQPARLAPGPAQSAPVGTAFGPLAATVSDGQGNPLGGIPITFTAPAAEPTGAFPGNTATAGATSAVGSGAATAPTFTASSRAGGPYALAVAVAAPFATTVTAAIALTNLPVATSDAYTTFQDVALTVAAPGLLANDAGGPGLTAALVAGPAHGTAALNADGSFTYTPAAGYSGPDAFTYQAAAGSARSATATVNLTVAALQSLAVVCDPTTIRVGGTATCRVTATYAGGGTQAITAGVTWTSSDPTYAAIDSAGTVMGKVPNVVQMTAQVAGVASPPVAITVTPPTLTGIIPPPAPASRPAPAAAPAPSPAPAPPKR